MSGVLAFVACLRGLRGWRASAGGVVVWVTWLVCQRGLGDWCACVGGVGGALKRKKLGDIRGNIGRELTVSWVAHYFSNSFQKLAGN